MFCFCRLPPPSQRLTAVNLGPWWSLTKKITASKTRQKAYARTKRFQQLETLKTHNADVLSAILHHFNQHPHRSGIFRLLMRHTRRSVKKSSPSWLSHQRGPNRKCHWCFLLGSFGSTSPSLSSSNHMQIFQYPPGMAEWRYVFLSFSPLFHLLRRVRCLPLPRTLQFTHR